MTGDAAEIAPAPLPEHAPVVRAVTLFRQRAERRPQALALIDPADRSGFGFTPGRTYRYGEAEHAVERLAAYLMLQGLEPGDRVAVQMPNVAETALLYLAAWRAGLTIVAMPYLWDQLEISEACAVLQPAMLIGGGRVESGAVADRLRHIAAAHYCVRAVAGFGFELPDGVPSLDSVMTSTEETIPPPARASYGPGLIGFTARPGHPMVPIPLTADVLLAQGAMSVLAFGYEAGDRILNAYPLSSTVGLSLALMPWLIAGGTLIQHQPFAYEAFSAQLGSEATITAVPPAVLEALMADGTLRRRDCGLRSLARVVHGSRSMSASGEAPLGPGSDFELPPRIRMLDVHPLGDLACVPLAAARRARDANVVPRGKLALGRAGDSAFIEIGFGKSPAADAGELLLRGSAVPAAARGGPLAPDGRGFVGTGLYCLPQEGPEPTLRLKDNPELIRHGGVLLAAGELDALYRDFPACSDAAVFVLPDAVMGSRLIAALVPKSGQAASSVALSWYLKKRQAAAFKIPDTVMAVSRIPRNRDGRVLRDQLADEFRRDRSESPNNRVSREY